MKRGRARFSGGATSNRRGEVLRAIAKAVGLSTAERCVLFALEAHVGYDDRETGRCWPAVETIGAAAGMSERQARRVLSGLRALGWIAVEERSPRGAQITSVYVVTPPAAEAEEDRPVH